MSMERRSFFKSLAGLLMLPFAKDLVQELPKSAKLDIVEAQFCWDASNSNLWYWQTPVVIAAPEIEGQWISIEDALEMWSGT